MAPPRRTRTRMPRSSRNGSVSNAQKPDLDHDKTGRFRKGNSAARGHGRPREDLRRRIRSCITEADLKRIMQTVVNKASAGSERHARLALEYSIGRPAKMQSHINIELPALDTLESCSVAAARIVAAVGSGGLGVAEGAALTAMTDACRSALEAREIEERVAAIEESLGHDLSRI